MSSEVWTLEAYIQHAEAMRAAEARFQAERDRRYTEVKAAEAMALQIKEEADKTALGLQRDYQLYRDEQANRLREQIGSERGLYVTRAEIKPLADYVTSQQGPRALTTGSIVSILAATAILAGLYFGFHNEHQPVSPTVTVTVPAPVKGS